MSNEAFLKGCGVKPLPLTGERLYQGRGGAMSKETCDHLIQQLLVSHLRYEFLRTLDDDGFSDFFFLRDRISFDEAVDWMRKERANEQT